MLLIYILSNRLVLLEQKSNLHSLKYSTTRSLRKLILDSRVKYTLLEKMLK